MQRGRFHIGFHDLCRRHPVGADFSQGSSPAQIRVPSALFGTQGCGSLMCNNQLGAPSWGWVTGRVQQAVGWHKGLRLSHAPKALPCVVLGLGHGLDLIDTGHLGHIAAWSQAGLVTGRIGHRPAWAQARLAVGLHKQRRCAGDVCSGLWLFNAQQAIGWCIALMPGCRPAWVQAVRSG